ncbi:uncharacterized protein KY384_000850 [Bacidia gigantensis]|uniref:uncharacterized protein n=1 Tax=Bacidia gigantensis TaxID=2732470 RepID=UPI001D0500A9|nr:uncharacterized protein KY384_000850 [Bacidia gigantensis]KAG8534008.1 hypothetical protein KY384_000850 [Bacidia gigantensis]
MFDAISNASLALVSVNLDGQPATHFGFGNRADMFARRKEKHREGSTEESRKKRDRRSKSAEKHGLFPLNSPTDHVNNIIAIHGLGGDAFNTWTDKSGHMWLRDSLPKDLPGSKIWTYGYDSAIAWSSSISGITDFAHDLLERLSSISISPDGAKFPSILICHSLGGIVAKKALTLAKLLPGYESVGKSIKAVVFMGTPHRGSRMSSYLTPLSRIVNAVTFSTPIRADLIGNLQVLSRELSEIAELAGHQLNQIPVISFYEQKKMKGIDCLVVEPASAILGIDNERAIPINSNHRDMVRFASHEVERYHPVRNRIKNLVDQIAKENPQDSKYSRYVHKLYCVDYQTLLVETVQPYPGTGTWLFENKAFKSWARESFSGICWLRAPAGFGKTVIARSIVENLKARTKLTSKLGYLRKSVIVHYFFRHEKSDTLSEASFLRSALHQLLLESPKSHLLMDDRRYIHSPSRREFEQTFSLELPWMWSALEKVLAMEAFERSVVIMDALDEVSAVEISSILEKLISMIRDLNREKPSHRIKIVILARPNFHIEKIVRHSNAEIIEIGPRETATDLETYVNSIVKDFGAENGFPRDTVSKIQSRLISGASGMFLWAHLAWEHFKHGVTIWDRARIDRKLTSLGHLPRGLEELYRKLFLSIGEEVQKELVSIFMIMCAAARPLNCNELGILHSIGEWDEDDQENHVPLELELTLQRYCPNLFSVDSDGLIHFVHLSLKEYLVERLLNVTVESIHQHLVQKCIKYIHSAHFEKDAIEDHLSDKLEESHVYKWMWWARREECPLHKKYLLLDYCATFLKYHMEQIAYDDPAWIQYSQLAGTREVFHTLTERIHENHARHSLYGGETPLMHVLRIKNWDMVPKFVEANYNINEPIDSPYIWYGISTNLHEHITDTFVSLLLLANGADPDAKDGSGRTSLHFAIWNRNIAVVERLLEIEDLDVNAQDDHGDTPLHYQVSCGAVPTLLSHSRIDVSKINGQGMTAMALSAIWGDHTTFCNFLDETDFDLDKHCGGHSPLICACQQHWREITLKLIKKTSNVSKHRSLDQKTVLHWAVVNGWDDVLQMALSHGAKVNIADNSGKTALHYAAQLGHYKAARYLLRHGASARIQDAAGRTAVHTAAVEGFADTLRPLILESDCDPNDKDQQHRSLVHWAASCDWAFLMLTVLEMPDIDIRKRDHHGRTATHVAAICGCPNVLKLLIEHDIHDCSEVDAFGNTTLHLAARGQSVTAVEVLIPHYELQKNRINFWGQTALDVAMTYGAKDIKDLLLGEGVRFNSTRKFRVDKDEQAIAVHPTDYVQTPDHLSLLIINEEARKRRDKFYGKYKVEICESDESSGFEDSENSDESYESQSESKL